MSEMRGPMPAGLPPGGPPPPGGPGAGAVAGPPLSAMLQPPQPMPNPAGPNPGQGPPHPGSTPPSALSAALGMNAVGAPTLGAMPGVPPGMQLNPAFMQWQQLAAQRHNMMMAREEQFSEACKLLRDDASTGFQIDIAADSTVAPDEQAEKASRSEFLQSILPMLQLLMPQVQQNPAVAPLIKALVMFGMHAFPTARDLEADFEAAFQMLANSPPPPPPPSKTTKSPDEIASEERIARGDQQVDQAKVQAAQQANAIAMMKVYQQSQSDQAKMAQEGQFKGAELAVQQQELQTRTQLEQARMQHMAARDMSRLV